MTCPPDRATHDTVTLEGVAMPGNELVARNVHRYRHDRRLSIGELGRRAGLAKQTVASLEAGLGNPTVETLERIAVALGVSLRALLSEMGTDVVVVRAADAEWTDEGALQLRYLGQVYGSGYVTTAVLRLDRTRGPSQQPATGRGSLRHCLVLSGEVLLGPLDAKAHAAVGDFVRFPAEVPHEFGAITDEATMLVVTTAPQLTMDRPDVF